LKQITILLSQLKKHLTRRAGKNDECYPPLLTPL
jgi:hypothetical protein